MRCLVLGQGFESPPLHPTGTPSDHYERGRPGGVSSIVDRLLGRRRALGEGGIGIPVARWGVPPALRGHRVLVVPALRSGYRHAVGLNLNEIMLLLLISVVPLLVGYVVIRLAVRHGVMDAHRRLPPDERPPV